MQCLRQRITFDLRNFMVFTSPRCNVDLVDQILFDNNVLFRTDVVCYLRFIIDSKLSWHYHILHVRDKVNKGLGILRRCSHLLPTDCLLSIYYAFVYPYLSYGIKFWGVSTEKNLDFLCVAQKACIRKIVNENVSVHCAPIAKWLGILLIDVLYTFVVACFVYNVFHNPVCYSVAHIFKQSNNVHSISTRQSNINFFVPQSSVTYRRWFITTQGSFIWNKLFPNFKSCTSLSKFKSLFKDNVFQNYI